MSNGNRRAMILAAVLGIMLLSACASQRPAVTYNPAHIDEVLASARTQTPPPAGVLTLNEALAAYVDEHVRPGLTAKMKLEKLREMIFSSEMLNLQYDASRTRTAVETWEAGRGNCFSMTSLFVAMARHVGLDAHYNVVETLPWWDRADDMMIWNEHINAAGELRNHSGYVLDFIPQPASARSHRARIVSDDYALALYWNNLGAEALVAARPEDALRQFRHSLHLVPDMADTWNNIAIAFRRIGRDDLAESSMLHAVNIDSRNYAAMNNLAALYMAQGREQEARWYQGKIRLHRASNPFYQYALGQRALEEGEVSEAIRRLKLALRLGDEEPEFYRLLHLAYAQQGDVRRSEKYRRLAETASLTAAAGVRSSLVIETSTRLTDPSMIVLPGN